MLDAKDVTIQFVNARYFSCYMKSMLTTPIYFQDVTQNENWNNCLDTNGQSLARCIYNCKDDESCEAKCVGQFKVKTDDCPCEVSKP